MSQRFYDRLLGARYVTTYPWSNPERPPSDFAIANIGQAKNVFSFDVMRDGHPANVQVEQSSGVPSLDQSAMRAIQRIDTFGPLPSDYAANKVSVEFWFDYKR